MTKKSAIAFAILCLFIASISASPICGRERLRQNRTQQVHSTGTPAAKWITSSTTNCDAEFYYDTSDVQERITQHFHIYYVLEGIHATKKAFVDSLATALEKAWNFYIQELGYKKPKAAPITWHYRKEPAPNRFPIEIADINSIRDNASLFGGFCGECIAVTFSPSSEPDESEIIIENDFFFAGINSPQKNETDSYCTFYKADNPMQNEVTGIDYTVHFGKLIRATAFHEFYHTLQFIYLPPTDKHDTYWYEASATAQEEIGAPDVNDYWSQLPLFFNATGKPFHELSSDYGLAVWELYNESIYGNPIGKHFWERFAKNPDASFEEIFAEEMQYREIDPDSSFNDFAERLLFSGPRALFSDSTKLITDDAFRWPFQPKILSPSTESVSLTPPAIAYYRITTDSIPHLDAFQGKASIALYGKTQTPIFYSLDTITLANILPQIEKSENAVLILSRLREQTSQKPVVDSLPMRNYPNPWRGETPLCFAHLPQDKTFIEIRTRTGKLVGQFRYSGEQLCLEAETLREKLAPGLYYFRAGNKNKAKPFLVVY